MRTADLECWEGEPLSMQDDLRMQHIRTFVKLRRGSALTRRKKHLLILIWKMPHASERSDKRQRWAMRRIGSAVQSRGPQPAIAAVPWAPARSA